MSRIIAWLEKLFEARDEALQDVSSQLDHDA